MSKLQGTPPIPWTAALIFVVLSTGARAQTLTMEEVLAPVEQIRDQCRPVDGEQPDPLIAGYMYTRVEKGWVTKVHSVRKSRHSYRCGKVDATVYLYEYADAADASRVESDAKQFIWGGNKPSSHHPEVIFTVKNVLVIVSSRKPKVLAECIQNREVRLR